MPFCPECGNETNTNDKFCAQCGKNLKVQTVNAKSQNNKTAIPPKQVKHEGTVHKCPFCGETVDSLKANCPSCGKEFRDTPTSLTVKEFSEKLIEISKNPPKNRKTTSSDPILPVDRMKIELIQGFPIPNSKEDIIDFMVLANTNIIPENYAYGSVSQQEVAKAWESKYEQAYQKARVILGDSQELRMIKDNYDNKKSEIHKKKKIYTIGLVLGIIGLFSLIGAPIAIVEHNEHQRFYHENQRLELILDEINEAIYDKDYDKAKLLTARLVFDTPDYNRDAEEKWDGIREDIYERINELESKDIKKK